MCDSNTTSAAVARDATHSAPQLVAALVMGEAVAAVLGAFLARTLACLEAIGAARRRRVQRQTLQALRVLDDHLLRDIGISRPGIGQLSRHLARSVR